MRIVLLLITLFSVEAFAIGCDCELRVYSPMTGSYKLPASSFKTYEVDEFGSYSAKNQNLCRSACEKAFAEDMTTERLNALLLTYSQNLIEQGALGYNCTGLTVLKYPVRLKASLGNLGLGNVVDIVQVVAHEEQCF